MLCEHYQVEWKLYVLSELMCDKRQAARLSTTALFGLPSNTPESWLRLLVRSQNPDERKVVHSLLQEGHSPREVEKLNVFAERFSYRWTVAKALVERMVAHGYKVPRWMKGWRLYTAKQIF